MDYTTIDKLGVRPSRLGFGGMRFPTTPEGAIDEPRATAMLDMAYQAGVNYYDTAYFYHDHTSEAFLGRALQAYPRDSFYLATKLPVYIIHSIDDAKRIFEEQLATLDTPYFDFYLLHALNAQRWESVQELGILPFLEEEQRKGRIKHLGFSFHDSYEVFERILTARDWDFCQIQFNYMDTQIQAGERGYELAKKLGVPIVVMEPVKGGSLATLSPELTAPFTAAHPDWTPASWAMRWVASHDNCRVILSGMSTEEQVEDNLRTFDNCPPLTQEEMKIIEGVRDAVCARSVIGCTKCRYCMPCPFGVNIPENFRMENEYAMYTNEARRRFQWEDMDKEERADMCRKCGKCESVCPQKLPIRQLLSEIAEKMKD